MFLILAKELIAHLKVMNGINPDVLRHLAKELRAHLKVMNGINPDVLRV